MNQKAMPVVLEMTPERRNRIADAAQKINSILGTDVPEMAEAFATLKLVWGAWEKANGVICSMADLTNFGEIDEA